MKCMDMPMMAMACPPLDDDLLDYDDDLLGYDDEPHSRSRRSASPPKIGTANAARVSRGSKEDTWDGLSVKNAVRNDGEHVTVTCVIYFTIAGGVPSEEDVVKAIVDMEELYKSCGVSGKLSDEEFAEFKKQLTVGDMSKIAEKIVTQPCENWKKKIQI